MSITEQLSIAHDNKKECGSLCSVITGIQGFLQKLPSEGLSKEGNQILGRRLRAPGSQCIGKV